LEESKNFCLYKAVVICEIIAIKIPWVIAKRIIESNFSIRKYKVNSQIYPLCQQVRDAVSARSLVFAKNRIGINPRVRKTNNHRRERIGSEICRKTNVLTVDRKNAIIVGRMTISHMLKKRDGARVKKESTQLLRG
jgi:hypothetical protein